MDQVWPFASDPAAPGARATQSNAAPSLSSCSMTSSTNVAPPSAAMAPMLDPPLAYMPPWTPRVYPPTLVGGASLLNAMYNADDTAAPKVAPLARAKPGETSAPTDPAESSMDTTPPAMHADAKSQIGNAAPTAAASTARGLRPFQNQNDPPGLFEPSSTSSAVSTTRFRRTK